jgi:hypothetical protein
MKKIEKIWDNLYQKQNYFNTISFAERFVFIVKYLKGQGKNETL